MSAVLAASGVIGIAAAAAATVEMPQWGFMWLTAAVVFFGLKLVTLGQALRRGGRYGDVDALAYVFGWIGLDGAAFVRRKMPDRARAREWLFCGLKVTFGAALVWAVTPRVVGVHPLLGGWIGMVGLVFVLHFGLFHAWALLWRALGRDVRPIMDAPVLATSVGGFWGRRWNRAFHDAVTGTVFRPCARRLGATGGMIAAFVVSGLIHELMISVPAGGGYGLPTAYFLVQGLAILIERTRFGQRFGLRVGARGWLFTATVTAGLAFILFHPPFVLRVVVPFLGAIDAG